MAMSADEYLVAGSQQWANTEMDAAAHVPKSGMVFCSPDEAFEFYKIYSRKIGFGITRRTSHNFYGIKYDVTFSCNKNRKTTNGKKNHEGFSARTHGVLGTGCRAKIVLRDRMLRGIWTIEEVILEHNHELAPDCVRLMRCHRAIPEFVKKQLEINELAGLAQNKSISAVFTQAGGVTQCKFTERDMRNYIAEVRRLQLSKGDAAALMDYFRRQQDKSPYFYYAHDLDDDGRLKNVFWADARSRSAYKYFGDVLTFDTTYLTNRYRMPFAVFVGVNHHGQSILLGCALLSNEMTATFEWCFQTFLSCMHGKQPQAIITDQCGAIYGAVQEVFITTRHRWCLWHILKKMPEKLAGVDEKDQVMHAICTAVYDSNSRSEFDASWLQVMSKYQLGNNAKWFEELYEKKDKWVPAYVMNEFWAGMSTTQRSEGMNAFFDNYINSKTSLKSFVEKYDVALHAKWEKERAEDFRCMAYSPKLVTDLPVEKQFASIYTLKMFYQFQQEIKMLIYCYCDKLNVHDSYTEYIVNEISKTRAYHVHVDLLADQIDCSCMQFEFTGIVCRHMLCVSKQIGIEELPNKFFMDRWRKDYVRSHMKQEVIDLPIARDIYAYSKAYTVVNQLVLDMIEIASRSSNIYQYLVTRMSILKNDIIDQSAEEYVELVNCDSDTTTSTVKDPMVVRSKGRPRSTRIKSGIESNKKKKVPKKKKRINQDPIVAASTPDEEACQESDFSNASTESNLNQAATQEWSATDLLMHFQSTSNYTS